MKKYINQTYKMFIYLVSIEICQNTHCRFVKQQSGSPWQLKLAKVHTAGLQSKAGVRADVAIATVGLTTKTHQGCKHHLSHLLKYHMLVAWRNTMHLVHTLYHFAMVGTLDRLRFIVRKSLCCWMVQHSHIF